MKKCTCNATNPDDAKFCRICGHSFDDSGSGITENPNRSSSESTKIVHGIKFVLIKGGTFMMGSPESEPGRKDDETQHEVTVSDFYMSEKTITNEQYCFFLNENNVYFNDRMGFDNNEMVVWVNNKLGVFYEYPKWHPAPGKENYPVIYLSWSGWKGAGAERYCSWIGGRLPTEAEWEYACRAGTKTAFNTGDRLTTAQANFDGTKPYIVGDTPGIKSRGTKPVGSYPPNAWGLYDMHGNVEECCFDRYEEHYEKLSNPNPVGYGNNELVRRGGGWEHGAGHCRSAARLLDSGVSSLDKTSFRVVLPIF